MILDINRLVKLKDISASRFDSGIACSIRTQHNVLARHMTPPHSAVISLSRRWLLAQRQTSYLLGWSNDLLVVQRLMRRRRIRESASREACIIMDKELNPN